MTTSPNLVQLFTVHGSMWVDARQLATGRTHLTIYTARGNKLKETGKTKHIRECAEFGVHRENLFASRELAEAAFEQFFNAKHTTH